MSFLYPRVTLLECYQHWNLFVDGQAIYPYLRDDIKAILTSLGYATEGGADGASRFEMDYITHSGDKQIARQVFLSFLINGNGFENIPSPTIEQWEDEVDGDLFMMVVAQFNARSADNIKSVYDAYTTEYKPLENYSMIEDTDYTPKAKQTVTSSNKSKTDTTTDVGVYGFNSTVAVPSSTTDSGTTQLKADNEMETTTSYDGESDNTHHERSGNIGVTTSQQMLESEIKLRKLEILELIFQGLDEVICQSVYD